MINGISAKPLPNGFPYKDIIEKLCQKRNFFPCLVGAIKLNETGLGSGPTTENNVSGDGGHGIMQLTSDYPKNWQDPLANITFAIDKFMLGAYAVWTSPPYSLSGDKLVQCIAASYNAGTANAQRWYKQGDVDAHTTNRYGERALQRYQALLHGMVE